MSRYAMTLELAMRIGDYATASHQYAVALCEGGNLKEIGTRCDVLREQISELLNELGKE